jgi:hypothetical protein
VVVAAGNGGYTSYLDANSKVRWGYDLLNISDPGNADLAITVGSTHRDMPHLYGVSYFSSKGPTGDGRLKPDLVAPGERIISCAAGQEKAKYTKELTKVDDVPTATIQASAAATADSGPTVAASSGTETALAATAPAAGPVERKVPEVLYCEMSGTSMAAPHVSGAIAAFLSVRTEFIGRPERVKEIFLASAIDLNRQRIFQGAGLIDLMRALSSV